MNIYFAGTTNITGVTLLNGTTANIIQLVTVNNILAISTGTKLYGTAGNWTETHVATAGEDAEFRGSIAAGAGTITVDAGRTANSLVATNNGAGTLFVDVGNTTYTIVGQTRLGTNTVMILGAGSASSGTFSTGNLVLQDNAGLRLSAGGGTLGSDTLIVSGTFSNSSGSFITNSGGGGYTLKFAGNQPVTNNGTVALLLSGTGQGAQVFSMQVGTSSNNFFVNNGTFVLGTIGTATSAKQFAMTNQFVNNGSLIVTNDATGGAAGRVDLRITGSTRTTGGASTNAATGTIRLVAAPMGRPPQPPAL